METKNIDDEKTKFMVYATIGELKKIKKGAKKERRSISSFMVNSSIVAAELVMEEQDES